MKVGDIVCYTHDLECRGIIIEQHEISGDVLVMWSDYARERYDTDRRMWDVEDFNLEVINEDG